MRNAIQFKWMAVGLVAIAACGCSSGGGADSNDDLISDPPFPTTVKVFIGNGHTQCNDNAVSLSQTQMMLVNAGIDVLDSACGVVTGVAFATVCGGPTGEINLHTIRQVNLPDADRLGFKPVDVIGRDPQVPGTGYQEVTCP